MVVQWMPPPPRWISPYGISTTSTPRAASRSTVRGWPSLMSSRPGRTARLLTAQVSPGVALDLLDPELAQAVEEPVRQVMDVAQRLVAGDHREVPVEVDRPAG